MARPSLGLAPVTRAGGPASWRKDMFYLTFGILCYSGAQVEGIPVGRAGMPASPTGTMPVVGASRS